MRQETAGPGALVTVGCHALRLTICLISTGSDRNVASRGTALALWRRADEGLEPVSRYQSPIPGVKKCVGTRIQYWGDKDGDGLLARARHSATNVGELMLVFRAALPGAARRPVLWHEV